MSKDQQDTEITLGTGRMLALFFTFVLVCAVFFAIGFSLGRKTSAIGIGGGTGSAAGISSTAARPSPAKGNQSAQSGDFSFYKTVGAQSANTELAPQEQSAQTTVAAASVPPALADVPPTTGGYFVQVAAVSHQEDAESLVEALKKKQYPALLANSSSDKFFHVQVGPYAELKEAEAMKARLVADGYSPIVKK